MKHSQLLFSLLLQWEMKAHWSSINGFLLPSFPPNSILGVEVDWAVAQRASNFSSYCQSFPTRCGWESQAPQLKLLKMIRMECLLSVTTLTSERSNSLFCSQSVQNLAGIWVLPQPEAEFLTSCCTVHMEGFFFSYSYLVRDFQYYPSSPSPHTTQEAKHEG